MNNAPMSVPAHTPTLRPHGNERHRGFLVSELIEDLRAAQVSRFLDDREIALQKQSRVYFQISGAGHEALLLALARHLRPAYDWFFPYYRDRALMLGLGVTPTQILQQAVGSAEDPSSGGRQMPCHWGYKWLNVVTQSSATGSQCISAVGCAEAARYLSRRRNLPGCKAHGDELTYVSLGEGATSQGEFWESLNTACTLHLPVLYVVEDNGYAISVPSSDQSPAPISELVRGFRGLEVHKVDGRDYIASRKLAAEALPRVRAGVGPSLIHATVTRPYSHSAADTQSKYRSAEELADEQEHDPIKLMREELVGAGVLTDDEADQIREEARQIVADAAKAALASRRPDPASVTANVYLVPNVAPDAESQDDGNGEPVAFGEAIRLTLHEQMARDQRIRVFGEDVADAREAVLANVEGKGGVFGTTYGLQREFGLARCYNTPLAEANIIGRAIGQALRGLRPAPEIQFFDYIWTAMQQIKTEAATIRWRSNGAFSCPMVIRVPIGGYLTGGAIWHSQCGESIFAHIPGLIVLMPSRARDAVGLLRTAFQCSDPVLFLEHKHLLRQPYTKDPFPSKAFQIPLGRGAVIQPGTDLTIVTYGATVEKSRQAAATLAAQQGASVEIIDLRSIVPWDRDMVAESVGRTGRVLVVHEDVYTCGFGAEVAAWVGEHCFSDLDAPVRRVTAIDTHVAYEPTLENAILPQATDIVAAGQSILAF
jgi:2-oxoisovalerate dehydrogenase E1 component